MSSAAEQIGCAAGQRVGVESLDEFFARVPRFALAFSGGCDSACLLAAAVTAGCEVAAFMFDTAFQARYELEDARRVADELGVSLTILSADILSRDEVCANGPDRCYACKSFMFSTLRQRVQAEGFAVLVDGTNASDDPSRRPGFRALAELEVVSPLRRAGLTKDDVRALSRTLGISTADKPSFPCLAVRVPQGERITCEALAQVASKVCANACCKSSVVVRTC